MSKALIGLVGDVSVDRENPIEVFSKVQGVLDASDIVFGNLEGPYTDDPRPVPAALSWMSSPSANLDVYALAGFDVMSLANNHILDVGYEVMLENRARLRARGVQTCGAGENIDDARRPAIVEAQGVRIAFLAYASVFPVGYAARPDSPGLVPMRAYNVWREANPTLHAPGVRPFAMTVPDEADLAALADDIRRARQDADLVITSFHWGDFWRPLHLTDHEIRTARYCVDHGAAMVVGHHHHTLRGMEWYKGRPIMYGLGHFVFDVRLGWSEEDFKQKTLEADPGGYVEQGDFVPGPREGWPLLPMPPECRMTVFAWAMADEHGCTDVGVLPCRLTPDGLVNPLRLDSPEGDEVIRYLDNCNTAPRLAGRLAPSGVRIAGFDTLRLVPA
jgi:capsule synthesis protein PGA_cap